MLKIIGALLPAALIGAGMLGYLLTSGIPLQEYPAGPETYSAPCPIELAPGLRGLAPRALRSWRVYRHRSYTPVPEVDIVWQPTPPTDAAGKELCVLHYRGAPEDPGRSADWRIGYALPELASLRGQRIRLTLRASAAAETVFDSASVYLYDGIQIATEPISGLGPRWESKTVVLELSEEATTLEAWLRLLIGDGTIVPPTGTIRFAAELAIDAGDSD